MPCKINQVKSMVMYAIVGSIGVDSLFVVALDACAGFTMFRPSLVMQCLVSFLVLQSSR